MTPDKEGDMDGQTMIMVAAVREHALKNYEKSYAWSEVIECYDDKDIERIIEGATTPEQAIAKMQDIVGVRDERYREAVGPETICECGETYNYEQGCSRCAAEWAEADRKMGDASP